MYQKRKEVCTRKKERYVPEKKKREVCTRKEKKERYVPEKKKKEVCTRKEKKERYVPEKKKSDNTRKWKVNFVKKTKSGVSTRKKKER